MAETETEQDRSGEVQNVHQTVEVDTFEGSLVAVMEAKFPAFTVGMDAGYPRGTHLRLNVEVRVKNVHFEETKTHDMLRRHVLEWKDVTVVAAFAPEGIPQAALEGPTPSEGDSEELGLRLGRTGDTW